MPSNLAPPPPLLAAEKLSISFGGKRVLDSVDFAISASEIVTLIGPNGSGKTTLLRALLGLARPNTGRTIRNAVRVAYVPQFFARDWSLPLTALYFLTAFGGGSRSEALEVLGRTGAADTAERPMASLSGGEMARVALARAILRRPDIIVLDEPLAGVDLAGEAALYELIAKLRDEMGSAVLLVSHDLHIVMAAADRVVCLNGHVCCEGDALAVAQDPAFLNLFGKRLAEQLALYAHHHDHSHTPSGDVLRTSPSAPPGEAHDGVLHSHGDHTHPRHSDG